jgi:hypothetical protein
VVVQKGYLVDGLEPTSRPSFRIELRVTAMDGTELSTDK